MKQTRFDYTSPFYLLIFLLVPLSYSGFVLAEESDTGIPENASANKYGHDWTCHPGYRKKDNVCIAITIPNNAYPTHKTYGRGWDCHWGYRETNGECNLITIPENAYLNYSGIRWECKRGYLKVKNGCVIIKVPENGYLKTTTYGDGWVCERGYTATKSTCEKLIVPENAHITFSGNTWECNRPYERVGDQCIKRSL